MAVLDELSCDPDLGPARVTQVTYVMPDELHHLALVLAACAASAGDPPNALLVFDAASSRTTAHLLQALLPQGLAREAASFTVSEPPTANGFQPTGSKIFMLEAAYSSELVADCCPDLQYSVTWTWGGSAYKGSPTDRAALYPLVATITASPPQARVGDEVTYTLTVTNTGVVPVTGVQIDPVTTTIPCQPKVACPDTQALVWIGSIPSCQVVQATQVVTCPTFTLAGGVSSTATVTMKITASLSPLPFQPEVWGVLPSGRLLPTDPSVTITVTG